jgi:c-di-GMP-binding flagellar brake protein YcgR
MNSKPVLKINTKIEIEVDNNDQQIVGKSIIQEITDYFFSIMVPMHNGHAIYLEEGDEVSASILLEGLRYGFKTKVLGKKKEADINLIVLANPQQISTHDRRDLVRIKTLLNINYEIVKDAEWKEWDNIVPSHEAYITDLSGTGLNLSLKWPLKEGLIVLCIPLQTNSMNIQLKLLGKVVRCEESNKRYRVGINFINITEKQQSLIINYVFHSLRKSIQQLKDGY